MRFFQSSVAKRNLSLFANEGFDSESVLEMSDFPAVAHFTFMNSC